MSVPTFGNLDIGQEGGARHTAGQARTSIRTTAGDLAVARSQFAFSGLRAAFYTAMGPRVRRITWSVVIRAMSETVMVAIESDIEALLDAEPSTMNGSLGETYSTVFLERYVRDPSFDRIGSGAEAGWIRRQGVLRFVECTP